MVIIKKILYLSVLLVVAVIATSFAGCSKPVDPSEASPLSVYRIKDGVRFSLGDKREDIEKIIDANPEVVIEFVDEEGELPTSEQEVYEQVGYEDITFDYNKDGTVLGIAARSGWKLSNGLKPTDSAEDVKKAYPAEYMHTYKQNDDIYFSLDENGNMIEFSDSAPYILRFDIEKYAIYRIIIKKNVQ